MLVLAVEVSHSPATPITSRPEDSWLKKRGWPETVKSGEVSFVYIVPKHNIMTLAGRDHKIHRDSTIPTIVQSVSRGTAGS